MHDPSDGLKLLAPGVRGALGTLAAAIEARIDIWARERAVARVWDRDPTLWKGDDPAHRRIIENRLGWLDVFDTMPGHLKTLSRLAGDAHDAGFERVVLLGMGGSSLCAEVLALTFDPEETVSDGLPLMVLDSTVPAAVRAVLDDGHALPRTLFVVASKSGTTAEVDALYRLAAARVAALPPSSERGSPFVAVTDPGTPLDDLARAQRFRAVFRNPPDIGGRFSALSLFGLLPAALLDANPRRLLDAGAAMAAACGRDVPVRDVPAAWLGAFMAEAALADRDKLTLALSEATFPLGRWIEQLVAESTGKEGRGILPVDGEPPLAPERYGPDRAFVAVRLEGEPPDRAAALAAAGHPVLELVLTRPEDLGGEFFRWELATALAGAALGIDPFDEPDVKDSKDRTKALLAEYAAKGRLPEGDPVAEAERIRLFADPGLGVASDHPADWIRAHIARVGRGDYLALLAYLARTPDDEAALEALRWTAAERLGCATSVGFGPRFLHSTGQLFKGGPDRGVFVQITADDPDDLPIPGTAWSFGTLARAQSLGDLAALHHRHRRAIRCHLHGDPGLGLAILQEWLTDACHRAAP